MEGLPSGSSPPSFSNDEVSCVREGHTVAVVGGIELDVAAGPVVLVVVLAAHEGGVGELEVERIGRWVCGWGCEGGGEGSESDSKVVEGDHGERL